MDLLHFYIFPPIPLVCWNLQGKVFSAAEKKKSSVMENQVLFIWENFTTLQYIAFDANPVRICIHFQQRRRRRQPDRNLRASCISRAQIPSERLPFRVWLWARELCVQSAHTSAPSPLIASSNYSRAGRLIRNCAGRGWNLIETRAGSTVLLNSCSSQDWSYYAPSSLIPKRTRN